MGVQIRKIEIFNFRSIRNITLKPSDLAVLVGNNDVGKSNILRALNLFFNEKTNIDESLLFVIDHNIHNDPNQRAKEIRVRLELDIPTAYHDTNGSYIVWEKSWRRDGAYTNRYHGIRETRGPRGGRTLIDVEIPPRSNLHGLLRNIQYVYVPAIKDRAYLSKLRASIYKVIAEVAAERFRVSSADFERSIAEHLAELTDEVTATLGFNSRLALPRDLSHIFESLDFMNEENEISLNERGDGVKTRHIPVILKFMADKKHTLQVRGAQPYSFIWGYEEPENNLELASSIKLADQLLGYLDGSVAQIFLTTHSPVFYNLHLDNPSQSSQVTCHHIFKDGDVTGTKETNNPDDLDEHMGTMVLFAPRVAELTNRLRQEQQALHDAEEQFNQQCSYLYVEGESDRLIIVKALQLFAPDFSQRIRVTTKLSGAGHAYVKDMLTAWRHTHKHHPDRPKSAGLVDNDSVGNVVRKEWNEVDGNCESAKCFVLPVPRHIHPIKHAGFKIPVVLETLYPRSVWAQEHAAGNLEAYHPTIILNEAQINRVVGGTTSMNDMLEDDWWHLYTNQFLMHRKISLATEIVNSGNAEALLVEFQPMVTTLVSYLFDA